MMKKLLLTTLMLTSLFTFTACTGGEVTKVEEEKKEPLKIVSTTVAPTEVTEKLGLDLVGIPTTKKVIPEKYKGLPEVGSAMSPNIESIVALMPDLVIIDNSFKDKYEPQLNEKSLKGFYFDTATVEGFKKSILELSKLTDTEKAGEALVKEINLSVESELKKAKKSDKKPTVAILFGTSESSMLATDKSYVGDLLNQIGVDNVTDKIEGIDSDYANFNLEEVVKLNPDYILRLSHGNLEQAKKDFDKMFSENPAWGNLTATKEGRVHDLNSEIYGVSANIKIGEAIKELGNIIYGEK
ncbi:MAG: ABC transporter substrate-binding protein [Clostridium sp.]|uniref:ABC transporter substrate-binding protein n=1 Tax=Clostridium sp. TaxID=1506 RepID=UPI003F3C8B55